MIDGAVRITSEVEMVELNAKTDKKHLVTGTVTVVQNVCMLLDDIRVENHEVEDDDDHELVTSLITDALVMMTADEQVEHDLLYLYSKHGEDDEVEDDSEM